MTAVQAIDRLQIPLSIEIRECTRDDLRELEWYGMFWEHRRIIREAFRRQLRGDNLMLVADCGPSIVGQVWIDLRKREAAGAGMLWALRVIPWLHRAGIGSRLVFAAERRLRELGFRYAEIGVELDNPAAKRLYHRLGYRVAGEIVESEAYVTPQGRRRRMRVHETLMRKRLRGGRP